MLLTVVGVAVAVGVLRLEQARRQQILAQAIWFQVPEAPQPQLEAVSEPPIRPTTVQLAFQDKLAYPPLVIEAVYLTAWSAGTPSAVQRVIEMSQETSVNAVVIDVKDYSGYVLYASSVPEAAEYGALKPIIPRLDRLISQLHEAGLYVIARLVVFQDPVLAVARPELAVQSESLLSLSGGEVSQDIVWKDRKGLAWMDPASQEVWAYNTAIAQELSDLGFDEVNFDYVRFPTDGDAEDMHFPVWDGATPLVEVMTSFASFVRSELPETTISADLFGLATIWNGDFGVGQILENFAEYFDFVSPMVYPSHYADGFRGFENPAEHPYEVVKISMDSAVKKLGPASGKLRPWLQDFDLGAEYGEREVAQEILAVREALGEFYGGFMLWSPSNIYTQEALTQTP